jgi:hypothetical protein
LPLFVSALTGLGFVGLAPEVAKLALLLAGLPELRDEAIDALEMRLPPRFLFQAAG